jgi:hydrogenase nickel incorporation protein HypA/HybF
MHEMGIALEIHRVCREAVEQHGGGRLRTVRLAIGELSAVEPDLIAFAWQAVTANGPDAGSTLDIAWCPATQHCAGCGQDKPRSEGSWLRLCPDCGQPLQVTGGSQLDVLEVVLEDEEQPGSADRPDPAELEEAT